VGCASTPEREPIPENTVQAKVDEAAKREKALLKQQIDVLAFDEYEDGLDALQEAQRLVQYPKRQFDAFDEAEAALRYFEAAEKKAASTGAADSPILKARSAALAAGLRDLPKAIDTLADVDSDLRDETDDFNRRLKPEVLADFQKAYLELEILAVQHRELGDARDRVATALKAEADDLAPKTLNQAQVDIEVAENLVEQSPRNPENYRSHVDAANASSILLSDVMEVIAAEEGTPESVALKVVEQNRAIGRLSSNVNKLQSNLGRTRDSLKNAQSALIQTSEQLTDTRSSLESQAEKLELASKQVRFQNAMEVSRRSFSPDVAEAYQQGNTLVFRIKKMGFATGKAEIPQASLVLLSQINEIVRELNADTVIVEGHTDSTGSAKLNQKLSSDRAIAVGRYLISLARDEYEVQYRGFGETRPIASNKTVQGRAQNRRVDLVVSAR
jgi:outer membrane protein OmpA-like peptidoglycan-associated protein